MKKLLALALAFVMIFAFAGCGQKDVADNKGGNSEDSTNTLVIGGIGPVTGAAADYGNAVKNGAQLAVDEINAAGGVNGMKLSFKFQDDEHDAEKSVNAYNTLKDDGMQVLMGTVTSVPCIAVSAEAENDNIFMLTPSGSAVDCIKGKNAFRICFSDPNQGTASARYIGENNLAAKVAVIYDSSDVYSSGIYETFSAEAKNQNFEVVTAQAYTKDSASDFTVQLQKVKESGAELVFLPIYYQAAALILQQAKQTGLEAKFFGCDGLDGVIKQLGDDVALSEGVMLLTPFAADATDDATVKFVTAYKAAFNNEVPTQFAADAYDAIYTIKAALEKAEVSDSSVSASELCDKLVPVMTEIEVQGVTGTMTWDSDGEPTKDPKAMVIEDGAYKAM